MATASRGFSRKRCLKGCERLPDAHRRAQCCADCLALHLAKLRDNKRRSNKSKPSKRRAQAGAQAAPPRRGSRSRRFDMLFGQPTAAPTPRKKTKAKKRASSRRAPPVAGIGLGDAASDRRDGLAASGGIASAVLIICENAYRGDERRADRERCIASVNALRSVADGIITTATADGSSTTEEGSAEIDTALEQMRLNLEDIQGQAEVDMHAKAEARRREEDERRREEESTQNRNLLIGGGVVLAVLAAGAGYVLLSGDDEAA